MSVPRTMRAVVLSGHGGLDKLEYHDDWPTPRPGPGEVLVRVGACGLNNTDINTRTAWYSRAVGEGITDAGGARGFAAADPARGSWSSAPIAFPRIQGADVAERGRLRPLLAKTFPLANLGRAQLAFLAKRHVGNIVVTP